MLHTGTSCYGDYPVFYSFLYVLLHPAQNVYYQLFVLCSAPPPPCTHPSYSVHLSHIFYISASFLQNLITSAGNPLLSSPEHVFTLYYYYYYCYCVPSTERIATCLVCGAVDTPRLCESLKGITHSGREEQTCRIVSSLLGLVRTGLPSPSPQHPRN